DRLLAADPDEAAALEELARLRVALAHLALEHVLAVAARAFADVREQRAPDSAASPLGHDDHVADRLVDPGFDESAPDGLVAAARDDVREALLPLELEAEVLDRRHLFRGRAAAHVDQRLEFGV